MLYKRKDSIYWWVKIKNKGKQIRQSTRTQYKAEARLFEDKLRRSFHARKRPVNTGICYVYIIGLIDSIFPIKIGLSKRPSSRLVALQTSHYETLMLYSTVKLANVRRAADIESAAHKIFKDVHIRGEWFEIDAHSAEETILRLVADDGPISKTG